MKAVKVVNFKYSCPYCNSDDNLENIISAGQHGKFMLCKKCNNVFYAYIEKNSCILCKNLSIENNDEYQYKCNWYSINMKQEQVVKAGSSCNNFNKDIPENKSGSCNNCKDFKNGSCHNFMKYGYNGSNGSCHDYGSKNE